MLRYVRIAFSAACGVVCLLLIALWVRSCLRDDKFAVGFNHASISQTPEMQISPTFQLPRGIQVADLNGIHESYSVTVTGEGYHVFTVNVSAENIHRVFCRLAAEVNEPAFLLLETGTHRDVEKQLRKNDTDPLHKDVYYLDGQKWTSAKSIIDSYSDLFVHDGQISFGFGSHKGHDEIFVGPYKIFTIFADEPTKYEAALVELGITKVQKLKTVWDNFTPDSPGQRAALADVTPTIWDMIEQLKQKGLYFAERRED
jgi:hypothetical protein